jgi:transposase
LKGFLKGLPKPLMGVVEAGPTWGWIYDTLSELGVTMIVANPKAVRAIAEAKIKTDKIDARMLAALLRVGLIPQVYVPSEEIRAQKMLWRERIGGSGCRYGLTTESIDCSTTIMSRCQNSAIFLDLRDADSWKS